MIGIQSALAPPPRKTFASLGAARALSIEFGTAALSLPPSERFAFFLFSELLCLRNCTRPVPRSPAKQRLDAPDPSGSPLYFSLNKTPRGVPLRPNLCTMQFSRCAPRPRTLLFRAFLAALLPFGRSFFIIRRRPHRCQALFAFFPSVFSPSPTGRFAAPRSWRNSLRIPRPLCLCQVRFSLFFEKIFEPKFIQ
jgi:hypothetical protein